MQEVINHCLVGSGLEELLYSTKGILQATMHWSGKCEGIQKHVFKQEVKETVEPSKVGMKRTRKEVSQSGDIEFEAQKGHPV